MDNNGYIKLHRSILKWEWYKDVNTRLVFLHLLLNANWENSSFQGCEIPKGSLIIGRKKLSKELGISEQSIRTALAHLKSTNEITTKVTNKYTLVTIVNWEKYQCGDFESTTKVTNKSTNNQPHKRNKEIKNIKNNNIFMRPTLEEVSEYCKERNNNVDPETFINFYESKGWYVGKTKMKDWKAAVRTWEKNRNYKPKTETKNYDTDYDFDELERQYGLK